MALANIAAQLALEGRKVLMIDFDLEAPGLDSFAELEIAQNHTGVVEYISHYLNSGTPDTISDYVQECKIDHIRGKLWLMSSGKKDQHYNHSRAKINWNDIYQKQSGALFIENWKAEIEQTYNPDYVFIDSRTGLTEVGGVCTLHFPDLVITLFGLNDQNIEGTVEVSRVIANNKRNANILPVATPVPNLSKEESPILQSRLQKAHETLGHKIEKTIRYYSSAALEERLFVLSDEELQICEDYEAISKEIEKRNQNGLNNLISLLNEACQNTDEELADQLSTTLLKRYPDQAETYFSLANKSRLFGDISKYEELLLKAIDIDAAYEDACSSLLSLYKTKKRYDDALAVLDNIWECDSIPYDFCKEIATEYIEIAMAHKQYAKGLEKADFLAELSSEDNWPPVEQLCHAFNYAEAKRRHSKTINQSDWARVISLHEESKNEGDNYQLTTRLNRYQAIHIAYACTGHTDKAKDYLNQAELDAQDDNITGHIFLVSEYRHGNVDEFLEINNQMKNALDKGELWDGMPLQA
jgi:tetratricopeptide (TPR) repeat protein